MLNSYSNDVSLWPLLKERGGFLSFQHVTWCTLSPCSGDLLSHSLDQANHISKKKKISIHFLGLIFLMQPYPYLGCDWPLHLQFCHCFDYAISIETFGTIKIDILPFSLSDKKISYFSFFCPVKIEQYFCLFHFNQVLYHNS